MIRRLIFPIASGLILLGVAFVAAQGADCASALEALWTAASSACIGGPAGYICNGGSAPEAEPAGPVSNALSQTGALVEVDAVTSMHTPLIDVASNRIGIAWLRLPAPVQVTGLLVGDVSIRNVSPADFPAWQSIIVETGGNTSTCGAAPVNVFIAQSPLAQPVPIVINGASVALNGTVLVRNIGADLFFVALSGQSSIIAFGQQQPLLMGEQISVPYNPGDFTRPAGPPTSPVPFDPAMLRNVPVALFDRPVILPQPGYMRTDGAVNMRSSPTTDAGVITQVPSGEVLSVLGADPSGEWYHVRRETGETGWMLSELLEGNVGAISVLYSSTPLPPQRYGELGSAGRVLAPAGVNLREGPDAGFPVVASVGDGTMVNLLARSPYSPWVKVEINGTIGWVALITLQTQAFIDALPIDFDVPPAPTPTLVPGTFGNAFPDPDGDG
jgi:uncharacterized protein YraI